MSNAQTVSPGWDLTEAGSPQSCKASFAIVSGFSQRGSNSSQACKKCFTCGCGKIRKI